MSRGETRPASERPDPGSPAAGLAAGPERTFVVEPGERGQRLDRVLQARVADLSRSRLQALIAAGRARVDGRPAKPGQRLRPGARITLEVPPPEPLALAPEPIPLDVVYEDPAVLVLNKPPGLVVHPGAGHRTGTLVHALLAHCGPALSGIGGARRPGIVHRLDRGTSGLLMIAKTDAAHQALVRQLKARTVERRYLALAQGRVPGAEGEIDAPIGRHPHDRLRMAVRPAGAGRPAVTRFRVRERFEQPRPLTLLDVMLRTGRTHQIRVHLAHRGFPLVGDRTYGPRGGPALAPAWAARVAALGGPALHAAVLGFAHPVTGAPLRFEVPPPAAFAALLAELRAAAACAAPPAGLR